MRTIEQIVEEVSAWGDATFPGMSIEDLILKFDEEYGELKEALSAYKDGPWLVPNTIYDAYTASVRRKELLDEIADNFIVLARLTKALGADFRQVIEDKWGVVKARDYSEPKAVSSEVSELSKPKGHELMRCEVQGKEGDTWVPMQFGLTESGYTLSYSETGDDTHGGTFGARALCKVARAGYDAGLAAAFDYAEVDE